LTTQKPKEKEQKTIRSKRTASHSTKVAVNAATLPKELPHSGRKKNCYKRATLTTVIMKLFKPADIITIKPNAQERINLKGQLWKTSSTIAVTVRNFN